MKVTTAIRAAARRAAGPIWPPAPPPAWPPAWPPALLLAAAGCCGAPEAGPPATSDPAAAAERPAASAQPVGYVQRLGDRPGLHNLFEVVPGVFSGSLPEGQTGFDTLKGLGIRSVISVDGGATQLDLAEARGMRYVHVPTRYSGITADEQHKIAAALKDLPRPVFVHCHHGKHRGPSATAIGLISLGEMTPEQGTLFQQAAGTSTKYPGLYECVGAGEVINQLAYTLDDLPARAEVEGLVATMVHIDERFVHLKQIKAAGWASPEDHPDLAPTSEAGMLAEGFRALLADRTTTAAPIDYQRLMQASADAARQLEDALLQGNPAEAAEHFAIIEQGCTDCHTAYRNVNW